MYNDDIYDEICTISAEFDGDIMQIIVENDEYGKKQLIEEFRTKFKEKYNHEPDEGDIEDFTDTFEFTSVRMGEVFYTN